jgi:hypothetical protein
MDDDNAYAWRSGFQAAPGQGRRDTKEGAIVANERINRK